MTSPKTTPEMSAEFLELLHDAYKGIVLGKEASTEERERLNKLGVALAHAIAEDAADAAAWRKLKKQLSAAAAESEFRLGEARGKMN